jgi:GNAT superfamily N-acetyltransferase
MTFAAVADRVTLKPASEVDPQALAAFYGDVFPDRAIVRSWRWLYRADADGRFPLVVADGSRVLAHAGGIPFTARIDGRDYRAAWYVDFVVRPETQRQGLGVRLTDEWMKQSELAVTFCNDKSMGVFRRFGWIESFDTAYHTLWLWPFEHPRLRRLAPGILGRIANAVARPIIMTFVAWSGGREPRFDPIDAAVLDRVARVEGNDAGTVWPVRDAAYVDWRMASSPDRSEYRAVRDGDVMMIVRPNGAKYSTVDVLWMSPEAVSVPQVARRMLASLALWAARNQRIAVRYYPSTLVLATELLALRPVVSHPRFAFWTRDAALLERLRHAQWRWQLVDSDFEWT